eukprot:7228295-Prymnesium_polylepis.1
MPTHAPRPAAAVDPRVWPNDAPHSLLRRGRDRCLALASSLVRLRCERRVHLLYVLAALLVAAVPPVVQLALGAAV